MLPVEVVVVPQHSDHLAELVEGLMHAGPHHPGGAGELLGRGVRAVLQRARVGGQQRQPVGEHVMHLAGDPRPLRDAGLGDAAGLFGLGAAGPLAQRGEQRLPGTVPLAPADERRPGGDHEHRPPRVRQRPVRPPHAADQVRRHVRAAGRHGDREAGGAVRRTASPTSRPAWPRATAPPARPAPPRRAPASAVALAPGRRPRARPRYPASAARTTRASWPAPRSSPRSAPRSLSSAPAITGSGGDSLTRPG